MMLSELTEQGQATNPPGTPPATSRTGHLQTTHANTGTTFKINMFLNFHKCLRPY